MKLPNTWVHDFGDFKMILDDKDNDLSRQVKHTGSYTDELLETKVIRQHVKKDMIVADLGANLGFYTMLSASLVGSKGKVYAFEPFLHNANLITASAELNQFSNVIVVNSAVADTNGETTLFLSPYYSSEHSLFDFHYTTGAKSTHETTKIKMTTLDEYLENTKNEKLDFIKMDIEGSEGNAIKGMTKALTINENITLLTEFWPNALKNAGVEPIDYLKKISELGFTLHHVDGLKQQIYKVSIEEIEGIMKHRMKTGFEQYKEVSLGSWYTTILCKR
ncbi:FkbM family methyltransferase [Candidatus Nitrosotenuis cloacae]|nr:FkbM family methyltransferase [Candidatus Nitrosotenuis cloacae]